MNTAKTYPVPFLIGDGTGDIMLNVKYIADFPRDKESNCAFCHGDPCAEHSPTDSLIAQYFERHREDAKTYPGCYNTCPCCHGKP